MAESTQHKLGRVRPPRVQITYEVEIGGATESKELPLVVGILADLAGQSGPPLPRLKERKFVQIDRDNFDDVMASLLPKLKLSVDSKLPEGGKLPVELSFRGIGDFHPRRVLDQLAPLKKLLEQRQRLVDLLAKLDGNDALNGLLQEALLDRSRLEALKAALEKAQSEPTTH
jgi:type VI secretion system protein ImpB